MTIRKHVKQLTIILAIIVCISTVFAAGGCSSKKDDKSTSTTAPVDEPQQSITAQAESGREGGAAQGPGAKPEPFKKYDPPIEMPVAYKTSVVMKFADGDDFNDNPWSRYLADKAGIILKTLWTADESGGEYDAKLEASFASNELPAVFSADYAFLKKAADSGAATDLSEIWENWASDRLKKSSLGYDVFFDSAKIGGKLMAIPNLAYLEQQGLFLWIRSDWLEAVGKSGPRTLEEAVDLARAFKNRNLGGKGAGAGSTEAGPGEGGSNDGSGEGGVTYSNSGSTYGIGLRKDIFNADYFNINGVMSAYGAPTRSGEQFFRNERTGKIEYAGIVNEARDALKLLNQLYAEGVIAPDFADKDAAAANEDINANKVGMAWGAGWNGWNPYAQIYASDKVIFKPYAPPPAQGVKLRIGVPFPEAGYNIVNGSYKNPEAVIVARNWSADLLNAASGDDVVAKYAENELWRLAPWSFEPGGTYEIQEGFDAAYMDNNNVSMVAPGSRATFNSILSFINTGDINGQGAWTQWGPEGSAAITMHKLKPAGVFNTGPITGPYPENFNNRILPLNRLIEKTYINIITGPQGEVNYNFDLLVNEWLETGGKTLLEDLNSLYPG